MSRPNHVATLKSRMLLLAVIFSALPTRTRADVMPWSGATASVQVLDQANSQSGATARASASTRQTIQAYSNVYGMRPTQIGATTSAMAGSTPQNLLSADTKYQAQYAQGTSESLPVSASASWSGDRVLLQSNAGAVLPSTVRLDFAVEFRAGYPTNEMSQDLATLTAAFNGKSASLTFGPQELYPRSPSGFDTVRVTPNIVHEYPQFGFVLDYTHSATFHIDLAISPTGISDPFQIGLTNTAQTSSYGMSWGLDSGLQGVTLSLKDVKLPDGRTPESEGFSLAFTSGLGSPNAVPEPGAIALFVAGFGALVIRRRNGTRRTESAN